MDDTIGTAAASVAEVPAPAEKTPSLDSVFDDAVGASATPDPAAPTSAATTPAAAIPPPTQDLSAPPVTEPPSGFGEPPKERWPDILKNTRAKTRDETLQEVVKQYGPSLQVVEALKADPVGTLIRLQQELMADPTYGPQLTAHAARTLGARRGQPVPEDQEPQPDLDAGNGLLLYSAPQQAKREAWLHRQWQQQLQQTLEPLQQDMQARRQRDAFTAQQQKDAQVIRGRIDQWTSRPHFTEHREEIRQRQQQYYEAGFEMWDALSAAYADVLTAKVLPATKHEGAQGLVQQAAKQLAAATPNPAAAAPRAHRRPRDIDDVFDQVITDLSAQS
jgi:hypothetical protein